MGFCKTLVFFILLFMWPVTLTGQFCIVFNGPEVDEIHGVYEVEDGWLIAGLSDMRTGIAEHILMKMGTSGNVIWNKYLGKANEMSGFWARDLTNILIRLKDGNYAGLGLTTHQSSFNASCIKFNLYGDTLWYFNQSGYNDHYPCDIAEDSAGNILLLSTGVSDKVGREATYLVKINGNTGKALWSRTYSKMDTFFNRIIINQNGDYQLFGCARNSPGNPNDYALVTAKIISSNGNIHSFKRFFENIGAVWQVRLDDLGYTIFGKGFAGSFDNIDVISRIDTSFNILDTIILPRQYYYHFGQLGAGRNYYYQHEWARISYENANGKQLKNFRATLDDTVLHYIGESRFGGYYGYGNIYNYNSIISNRCDFFIFKTDSSGIYNFPVPQLDNKNLVFYPNPLVKGDALTIYDPIIGVLPASLEIYAMDGKRLLAIQLSPDNSYFSRYSFNTDMLSEGIYFCVLRYQNTSKNAKFVVIR